MTPASESAPGPWVVALTGGIGSGKSTVARVFEGLGARVIDADEIAHRLIDRGAAAYDRVVEAFGGDIVREDGSIDRGRLGRIVFADVDGRRLLESILHPLIRAESEARIERQTRLGSRIAISNAALLVENPRYRSVAGHGSDTAGFARALQDSGYATDPQYADKISRILDSPTMRTVIRELKNPTSRPIEAALSVRAH